MTESAPPQWIDTHCHLDAREFDADRAAVVARANAAGVTMQVIPAVGVSNFAVEQTAALAHYLTIPLVSQQPQFSPLYLEPA